MNRFVQLLTANVRCEEGLVVLCTNIGDIRIPIHTAELLSIRLADAVTKIESDKRLEELVEKYG